MSMPLSAQNAGIERMHQRAKEIIAKMTVDEKISQMMNAAPGIPRLGIKPYNWWSEGLHGVGRDGRATVFPQPIAMASTFDAQLIKQIGNAIAMEGRAKYKVSQSINNWSQYTGLDYWAPNVNIFRDPRWGRGMETYGEDPYLTGLLGSAYVEGMQGDDPVYLKVSACGKHFAVHSGPEKTRHGANYNPSKHDLWETYLPAFRDLVQKAHVETIMGAYTALYGESCSGSKALLTDLLRNKWGFKGHVVSDCGAVTDILKGHHIAKTEAEAAAIALKAGINLECGSSFKTLKEALKQGLVAEADIDKALEPLLVTRLRLGILENDPNCPYNNVPESEVCSEAHTALAHKAALESMVLLKNDGTLPLNKKERSIYITGPAASDAYYLMGNYFGVSNRYSTYLQGIVGKVSAGTTIDFRTGFNQTDPVKIPQNWAWTAAGNASVTIVFIGNSGNTEGEEGDAINSEEMGDRTSLALPKVQIDYLRKVNEASKWNGSKVVTVVTGGGPIDMATIDSLSNAVVLAWYPGQEGGYALGDLLFGDSDFQGRLPITFPKDVNKLPAFDDYTMKGRTYKYMDDSNIQFPFGYGLSYSKATYSNLQVSYKKGKLTYSFDVDIKGLPSSIETAQVYLTAPGAGVSTPKAALVDIKKVQAGSGTVSVEGVLDSEQLKTVQEDGSLKLLKGNYTLTVGGAAPSSRTKELGVSSVSAGFKI